MSSMWCTGIATPGSLLGNKQGIAKYSECADLCVRVVWGFPQMGNYSGL